MEQRLKFYFWFLTIASVVLVGFNLLQDRQFSWTADEGYYYTFASSFAQEGFACFPKLFHSFWSVPKLQWYPTPSRLGYIIPAGLCFKLWPSMAVLGFFSFLCYVISLYVNTHFALKILKHKVTAYAMTAVLAASPLLMAMGRRALTESLLFLLWSSLLWLCTDYIINKQRKHLGWICGLLIWALMVKESTIALFPLILAVAWLGREGRSLPWREWLSITLSLVLGLFLIPGLLVGFERWIHHLIALQELGRQAVHVNPYVKQYCQGPWFRYLVDAMLLSPIVTLMAVGYLGHILLKKDDFKLAYLWLAFFLTVYLSCISLQMNVRYVIGLEAVYSLFAVLFLAQLTERFSNQIVKERVWLAGVSLIIVTNWMFFYQIFVVRGLLDPISCHLLVLQHFIPPYGL